MKITGSELTREYPDRDDWKAKVTLRNNCPYPIQLIIAGFSRDWRSSTAQPTTPYPDVTLGVPFWQTWPGDVSFGSPLPWPKLDFTYPDPLMPDLHRNTIIGNAEWVHEQRWSDVPSDASLRLYYKTAYCKLNDTNEKGEPQNNAAFYNSGFAFSPEDPGLLACVGWSQGDVDRAKASDPLRQHWTVLKPKQPNEDSVADVNRLMAAKNYVAAQASVRLLLSQIPASDPRQSQLRLLLGQAYVGDNKPALALTTLFEGYKKHPRGPFAGQSLAEMAATFVKMGKLKEACKVYSEFHDVFSGKDLTEVQRTAFVQGETEAGCPQKLPRW